MLRRAARGGFIAGKKIGDKRLAEVVKYAREKGLKVSATCPFALAKLKKTREYGDVFGG
jgi:predicted GNAT family acetyltransferase